MVLPSPPRSVFISLVQAVFTNGLTSDLPSASLSKEQLSNTLAGGVTDISVGLTGPLRTRVLDVVNDSLTHAWLVPVVFTSVSLLGTLAVEHRKIRGKGAKEAKDDEAATEETKEGGSPIASL
jgi:hypothetical protein